MIRGCFISEDVNSGDVCVSEGRQRLAAFMFQGDIGVSVCFTGRRFNMIQMEKISCCNILYRETYVSARILQREIYRL